MPMLVGLGGVRRGVSDFIQVVYTKPLDICYDVATVFNLIFDCHLFEKEVLLRVVDGTVW